MHKHKPVRVLFFGMLGEFSRLVFESLCDLPQAEICGVISTGGQPATGDDKGNMPVRLSRVSHIGEQASDRKLPWLHVDMLHNSNALEWITERMPDLILVACFSHYIPSSIHQLPELGSYNLHPSLLPAYRGPMPMFWQFRNAESSFGVTLHQLVDKFDCGPITLQESHKLVPGCSGVQMNKELGELAASLAVKFISALPELPVAHKQDGDQASYYGYPTVSDFRLDANSTARRAFIFMRGTQHWSQAYIISLDDEDYEVDQALEFREFSRQSSAIIESASGYSIQFKQGLLRVQKLRKL